MVKKFREKETGFKDKKETYIYIYIEERDRKCNKKKKNGVEHMVLTFNFKSAMRIHKTKYNI